MAYLQTGWLALLLAAVLAPGPAAAGNPIYMFKQTGGHRVYTDRKPEGAYVVIDQGRPTATASCFGLTPQRLNARAVAYDPLIRREAEASKLAPELVRAVMRVESCFDERALSRAGARGLMQLMPQTARHLGVRDSFDPEQNVAGGARYLRMMLDRFDNDLRLALAAYNAGPNAVEKYGDVPPFRETQNYVRRVVAAYGRGS